MRRRPAARNMHASRTRTGPVVASGKRRFKTARMPTIPNWSSRVHESSARCDSRPRLGLVRFALRWTVRQTSPGGSALHAHEFPPSRRYCCHPEPFLQKVPSRVQVAVMPDSTVRARPLPLPKSQRLEHQSAHRASLRARIEPVDLHEGAPIPLSLVLELSDELREGRVGEGSGEASIAKHPGHVEVLHHERLVFAHEGGRDLVVPVVSAIPNPGMGPSQSSPGLFTAIGAPLPPGDDPSEVLDPANATPEGTGSLQLPAIRESCRVMEAEVDAHRRIR